MIVLDTNVVSELLRPAPARQVEEWLSTRDGAMVHFTAVGEAELRHGVAILPAGGRGNAQYGRFRRVRNRRDRSLAAVEDH
jgi:hypothetical protein